MDAERNAGGVDLSFNVEDFQAGLGRVGGVSARASPSDPLVGVDLTEPAEKKMLPYLEIERTWYKIWPRQPYHKI